MNLLELIRSEKVEWKRLGDVCEFKRGTPITQKDVINGQIPVIAGGQKPAYYHGISNRDGITIAVAGSGAYAGFVSYWEQPIFLSDAFSVEPIQNLNKRYLYHWLLSIQHKIYSLKQGGGIPHVYGKDLGKFKIPIPSLEIQQKIVEILDKFTEYIATLNEELTLRVKQYEYYRDKLLSEKYLSDNSSAINKVEIKSVCFRQKGINITAKTMKELNSENGNVKVFAGGNTIAFLENDEVGQTNIITKPSIIVKSRGNIDFEYYDKAFTHKNEMWSYSTLDDKKLNIKFLYYYLKNNLKYFKDNAITGKLPQISTGLTDNYIINLPDIETQNHIVDILDKFNTLANDLKEGLPREIELRGKQYEYYREKLFDFKS